MLRLGRCGPESLDAVGDLQKRGLFERLGGSHGHGRAACERRQGSNTGGDARVDARGHEDQWSLHL